jgi:hypothetical protein
VVDLAPAAPPVAAVPVAQPDKGDAYVGLVYADPPPGITWHGGALIIDGSGSPTEFAITHMEDQRGEMMWLERLISFDERGVPTAQVLSVLRLPALEPQEQAVIGDCRTVTGRPLGSGLVAVADQTADPAAHGIARYAWTVDVGTGTFVPVPAGNLSCGWEDDGL